MEYSQDDQVNASPHIRHVAEKKRQPDNCSQCIAQKNRFRRGTILLFAHENREKGKEYPAHYGDNISQHVSDGDIVYEKEYHACQYYPDCDPINQTCFFFQNPGAKECNMDR